MAGVAFKTEKEYRAWLERNPQVAPRVRDDGTVPATRPVTTPIAPPAVSAPTSVVVRLPTRGRAASNHYAPARAPLFDRVFAWFCVATVGVGALGAWGCLCGILALEYVR